MTNEAPNTERERIIEEIPLFIIDRFRPLDTENEISGYIATSTATNNVEENERKIFLSNSGLIEAPTSTEIIDFSEQTELYLQDIANKLMRRELHSPEIVIAVHGFNNNYNSARSWYEKIYQYINTCSAINKKNTIFIGYRWPSENFVDNLILNTLNAFKALPILPRNIFFTFLGIGIFLLISLMIFYKRFLVIAFGFTTITTALIFSLIVLRLVVYFRDSYRASYFGTPDLVELVRQLDRVISQCGYGHDEVKLSFLGHSLGCAVIVNTIRILSDVFDPNSIGTLDPIEKQPSNKIGRVFQLERLVLVAPDIPVESVVPKRSNFRKRPIVYKRIGVLEVGV